MAVTLNDLAMVQPDPLKKAVLTDLLRQSKILQLVPIESVPGHKITQTRWQTMSTTSTRKIGGTWTENTGVLEQVQETMFVYGGEIKVDRLLTMDSTVIEDPLITQTKMKAQALAAAFNDSFINGDHASDPDVFEGLKKRVSNFPARMTIDLGNPLLILADTASEHSFVDGLHELVYKTGANALIMNENTYLGIGKVLRRLNLLSTVKDQYDRTWSEFAGAKLVDVGLKSNQSTEIITDTEDPGDGGADSTSIYGVRFDGDDGLRVIQLNGTTPEPYDPTNGTELETAPAFIRRIDWMVGLQTLGRYAVGRLHGFKVAAS